MNFWEVFPTVRPFRKNDVMIRMPGTPMVRGGFVSIQAHGNSKNRDVIFRRMDVELFF